MKIKHSSYDLKKSIKRINEILSNPNDEYKPSKSIPERDRLTFKNGFNVEVTVIFIDIRGSKKLVDNHHNPVLAKIYRSYISEVISVLRDNEKIHEVYIEGDGVWGVFNTVSKTDVNSVFVTASRISSVIDILNIKLKRKKYTAIKVGIGIDKGKSLYMKAGYKGININEIVWIGDVVGQAAKLCSEGNKRANSRYNHEIMISSKVYKCLDNNNKQKMKPNSNNTIYCGRATDSLMDDWVKKNG